MNTVAIGNYIGKGTSSTSGGEVAYTVIVKDKKLCWVDYKSDNDSLHSEGDYVVNGNVLKYTVRFRIGGLPRQLRVGEVYEFAIKPGPTLEREGIDCRPQFDTFEVRMVCAKCEKPIVGETLKADNQFFHKECLACDGCNKTLASQHLKTDDGRRLCPNCVPKRCCRGCNKTIEGSAVSVGGNLYHQECFNCGDCRMSLSGGEFFPKGDKLLCKACVDRSLKAQTEPARQDGKPKVCAGCGKKIERGAITPNRADYFHEECFKCADCGAKLGEEVIARNGKSKNQFGTHICGKCHDKTVRDRARTTSGYMLANRKKVLAGEQRERNLTDVALKPSNWTN
jgi:hypothetical protein